MSPNMVVSSAYLMMMLDWCTVIHHSLQVNSALEESTLQVGGWGYNQPRCLLFYVVWDLTKCWCVCIISSALGLGRPEWRGVPMGVGRGAGLGTFAPCPKFFSPHHHVPPSFHSITPSHMQGLEIKVVTEVQVRHSSSVSSWPPVP